MYRGFIEDLANEYAHILQAITEEGWDDYERMSRSLERNPYHLLGWKLANRTSEILDGHDVSRDPEEAETQASTPWSSKAWN